MVARRLRDLQRLGVVDKEAGVGTDADRWLLVRKT